MITPSSGYSYKARGVIAGTSAGASAMCETMLVSGNGDETLKIGDTLRMAPGLGFVKDMIIDQHFCLIEVRLIYDYDHEDLHTLSEVSEALLRQVEAFFVSYNQQRGKEFTITGTGGPKKAIKVLKSGIQAHKKATKE